MPDAVAAPGEVLHPFAVRLSNREAGWPRAGLGPFASLGRALALGLLVAGAGPAAAQGPIPPLTGPVVDAAGLLGAGDVRRLSELSRSARAREDGQGVQLQYLVVRSLQGEPIADYSIRVAEAWKIGSRGRDNGLLLTVAVDDRAWRIEVGGGLEGEIPDVLARRIGERTLVPAFRAGQFGDGLYDAGAELLTLAGVAPRAVEEHARRRGGGGVTGIPFGFGPIGALLVILWIVSSVFRGFGGRRRRHLWWGGGPFIGGGFGGRGGLGGGGWSGGGGGFSGGGASGRW